MSSHGLLAGHSNQEVLIAIESMRANFMDTLGLMKVEIMSQFHKRDRRVGVLEDHMRLIHFRDQGGPLVGRDHDDVPPS